MIRVRSSRSAFGRSPVAVGFAVVAGAFAIAQGCGGSSTEDSVKTNATAGSAGSMSGSGAGGTTSGGAGKSAAGGSTAGKAGASGSAAVAGTAGTTDADLFDIQVPDAPLGDSSVAQCYECVKTKCKDELLACQESPSCGPPIQCIIDMCPASLGSAQDLIACALGCGANIQDPKFQQLGLAVVQCIQGKCMADCPSGGQQGQGGGSQGAGGMQQGVGGGTQGAGGGFNPQLCQMNVQKCGSKCQAEGLACVQAPGCSECLQTQGQAPGCTTNAAWLDVIACACKNPVECAGCCPN